MNDVTEVPGSLEHRLQPLARAATVAAAIGLFGMVVAQGWQVLARYVLNASPSWTEPVTLICLTTTLAFGAAAGVHARSHFRFPLLVLLLPEPGQRAFARLSAAVVILIGLMLAVFGTQLALDGLDIRLAGAPIPQSTAYFPLALGGVLMSLFSVPHLLRGPLENS